MNGDDARALVAELVSQAVSDRASNGRLVLVKADTLRRLYEALAARGEPSSTTSADPSPRLSGRR
jgi:hypothetical protein